MRSSDNCRRGKSPTWHVLLAGWREGEGEGSRTGRDGDGPRYSSAYHLSFSSEQCVRGLPIINTLLHHQTTTILLLRAVIDQFPVNFSKLFFALSYPSNHGLATDSSTHSSLLHLYTTITASSPQLYRPICVSHMPSSPSLAQPTPW